MATLNDHNHIKGIKCGMIIHTEFRTNPWWQLFIEKPFALTVPPSRCLVPMFYNTSQQFMHYKKFSHKFLVMSVPRFYVQSFIQIQLRT